MNVSVPEAAGVDDATIGRIVREIVAQHIGRSPSDVPLGAKIEEELDIDSMTMIEISVSLEERFGIAMPDMAVVTDVRTVGDVARTVASLLAEEKQ